MSVTLAPPRRVAPARVPRTANRPVVVLVAAVAALQPLLRPSGPLNSSPVDIVVLAAVAMGFLAWTQGSMPFRTPYAVAFGLLLLGGCAGAMVGPLPGAGLLAVSQDLPLFFFCAVATSVMAERRAFEIVIGTWARAAVVWAGLLVVGVFAGIQPLSGIKEQYGVRASLTMGDPNAAADFFVLSFFVVIAAGVPRRRPLRVAALLLMLTAILLTGSNGATTAVICGGCVALVTRLSSRFRFHTGVALVVMAGAMVVAVSVLPLGSTLTAFGEKSARSSTPIIRDSVGRVGQSAGTRTELATEALTLYRQGDPLGAGPATTKTRLQTSQAPYAKEAHSDYSASLIERGPLGVLGVLLLLASSWASAWRCLPTARAAALLGGVTAVFISGAFYEVLHFRQVWVLLAVVAACAHQRGGDRDATR